MSERTVRLDVGTQANSRTDSQTTQSGGGGLGERPAEENIDRFRRSLAGDAEADEACTASQPRDASQATQASGAFSLFGSLNFYSPPAESVDTIRAAADCTARLVSEVADRILICVDEDREARVHVREDVMPGVEVRIAQERGGWVVAFIISDAGSFKVLAQAGQRIADELADRLQSAVEVQLIAASEPDAIPTNTFFADAAQSIGVSL